MKKQKIYLLMSMLTLLLWGSCSLHEEESLFEDSSANRISASLESYKDILVASQNGWLMQYYPSAGQTFGGYCMFVSFSEDGKATMASEITGTSTKITSLYSLIQSAGPVLKFDSYNRAIHLFCEPTSGLGGDFEFTIMEATPEKVVMSGIKTKNSIVLTPVSAGETWENYLTKVIEIKDDIFLKTFYMKMNGEVVGTLKQTNNVFRFTTTDGETQNIPFCYTSDGIQLYEPVKINGVTMSTFTANVANMEYVCADAGVDVKFESLYPQGYRPYSDFPGRYTMTLKDIDGKSVTRTVTVTANPDGKSYTLTGFYPIAPIRADYDRAMGALSITVQPLPQYNGYFVYLCVSDNSSLSWAMGNAIIGGGGMVGVNSEGDPLTITFVDNGMSSLEVNTLIAFAFQSDPPSGGANMLGYLEWITTPAMVKQ